MALRERGRARTRPPARRVALSIVMALAALGVPRPAGAQEAESDALLVLEELDREGTRHPLAPGGVADLNGTLVVGLGRDAIRAEVLRRLGPSEGGAEIVSDLVTIQSAVAEGRRALGGLEGLLDRRAADPASVDTAAVRAAIQQVAGPGAALVEATERFPELASLAEAAFADVAGRPSVVVQYRLLFDVASAYVDRLETRLDRVLRDDGVYVQLGAWILADGGARPVHLPYFDAYPVGEAYEVEAFQLALSDETRASFESAMTVSRAIESDELGRTALGMAAGLADEARGLIAGCVTRVETGVQRLGQAGDAGAAPVLVAARDLAGSLALARSGIASRARSLAELADAPSAERVAGVMAAGGQLDTLRALVAAPVAAALALRSAAEAALPSLAAGSVSEAVEALLAAAGECGDPLRSAAEGYLGVARDAFTLLAGADAANHAILEFGEEVERVSLDALPAETSASLLTAGRRDLGDRMVVRLAAGSADAPREVLHERRVGLYHMGWYGRTTAGLVFAHPSSGTEVRRYFHPAPSYSVLLKHGSRRRPSVNTFWTPGLGLNVASLDFDHDDDPELGVALVFALVRDYLQVGYGYNMGVDRPYWFFGLRLPGTSFTLSPGTSADVEGTL